MSGYDRIALVAQYLSLIEERIIVQTEKMPFAACRTAYIDAYLQGKRPIWLATGPAGTGLDLTLNALAPEDDFLLSDLIIPNVPIGMNQSTVHKSRVEVFGYIEEMMAATLIFKQWLGRLIRREGVTHRRIWMLDGRVPDRRS